jgi:hypothetical protein
VAVVAVAATGDARRLRRPTTRRLAIAFAVAGVGGMLSCAPAATASPACTQTGPTTTQCQTPGHAQITTSPPAMNNDPWWPYGGFVIGFRR